MNFFIKSCLSEDGSRNCRFDLTDKHCIGVPHGQEKWRLWQDSFCIIPIKYVHTISNLGTNVVVA